MCFRSPVITQYRATIYRLQQGGVLPHKVNPSRRLQKVMEGLPTNRKLSRQTTERETVINDLPTIQELDGLLYPSPLGH